MIDQDETRTIQKRYNRIAPIYDLIEVIVEQLVFNQWREGLWSHANGREVLEVGVGTGKNLRYHPNHVRVTAIDFSSKMMARAMRRRSQAMSTEARFLQTDAQHLAFADDTFDAAVATFVFCSVPDAVLGLKEVKRVVRARGQVLLLEHVRINAPIIGPLMDLLDPVIVSVMGTHIVRHTVENVQKAGLVIDRIEEFAPGAVVKLIHAHVP